MPVAGQLREVNLKAGMPSVDEARRKLNTAIDEARRRGDVAVKLIHGYGSSGVGGSIKKAIHSSLRRRRKEGKIRSYAPGEKWSIFESTAAQILDQCPSLRRDPDLDKFNEGVTVVLL